MSSSSPMRMPHKSWLDHLTTGWLNDSCHIRPSGRPSLPTNPQFMFDVGSPNAYLSHQAIPDIEKRTGAKFEYVPILLGGIFKATNNKSPAESLAGVKNKPEFMTLET